MSEQIDDGGPAFPQTFDSWGECRITPSGMSLRDYFAGQALLGLLAGGISIENAIKLEAGSYTIANNMIAERNREQSRKEAHNGT